jgi:polygalacturonase
VTTTISGGNTDGCDPESCDHMVIKNCTLGAGDDNIAIKSGRDADGRRINTPCQNLVIWNNQFEGPSGAIAVGSELTGGIQNVYAFNNATFGTSTRYLLYGKSNTRRGGFARNIQIDTFRAGISEAVVLITMTYDGQTGSFLPELSGPFSMNRVTVDTAPMVLNLEGLASDELGPINLSNSTFTHITTPSNHLLNISKVSYTNVTINDVPVR